MITSLLLKNRFGKDDVPLKITSTYFSGSVSVLFFMNRGILISYSPTAYGLKLALISIVSLPLSSPLFFYIVKIPSFFNSSSWSSHVHSPSSRFETVIFINLG